MPEYNLLQVYPKTCRNVADRKKNKEACRAVALKFGYEYFDGTREQGYGGYHYDGRWVPIAHQIIARYGLKPGDRVLDVGCAKGYLVKDLLDACPGLEVVGVDISDYAIEHCHPDVVGRLSRASADDLPFPDRHFQAVLCINVIHNLNLERCSRAITEIERVGTPEKAYIQVDAYRSERERQLFVDWMLTAETYGTPEFWQQTFDAAGYTGDYYYTILEADPALIIEEAP